MLKCLKDPSEIQKHHTDDETFALKALKDLITKRQNTNKKKGFQEHNKQIDSFALQKRPNAKFYRLIKANSLAVLMRLDIFDNFTHVSVNRETERQQT